MLALLQIEPYSKILTKLTEKITNSQISVEKFIGLPKYSHGCDSMRFIFQHSPLCSLHTCSIVVAVLGFHWSKKPSIADIISSYELFSQ